MDSKRSLDIPDVPLRDAKYFDGPLSWWNDTLTCGGIERQIVASAKYFHAQGQQVRLLCYNCDPRIGKAFFLAAAQRVCRDVLQFSLHEIDIAQLDHVRHIVATLIENCDHVLRDTTACIALWLLHVRPQLLHIWNGDNLKVLLAAVIAGVPRIVISGQSMSPRCRSPFGFESVDADMSFAILSLLLRLPGVHMTNNSRAGCQDYEEWLGLPPNTVTYTPNILDMSQWRPPDARRVTALRRRLHLPEGALVLGGLFRCTSIKDPALWVDTALLACSAHPNLYAVLAGDGSNLSAIRKRLETSPLASRLRFPGMLRDVPAFFSLCTVLLHTAHVEGLPNAVLEAHACAVPVVTTRCGGVADIVAHGESGFVIDQRQPAVLARCIGFLISHRDFALQAGRRGRSRVARQFAADKVMSPLQHLYTTMLHKGSAQNSGMV